MCFCVGMSDVRCVEANFCQKIRGDRLKVMHDESKSAHVSSKLGEVKNLTRPNL